MSKKAKQGNKGRKSGKGGGVPRSPLKHLVADAGSTPLVSCICPTYGRAPDFQHLLEEAIESFLRQTYPHKELVVLNDCSQQELVCDAPGVRVINVSERSASLGEKYNAAIMFARGPLIAPWEDDDISLPWRLSLSVERLGSADYYNPQRYWYLTRDALHSDHNMGVSHNLSIFTRSAFFAVGGYPSSSGPQDAQMDAALRSTVTWVGPEGSKFGKWAQSHRVKKCKKLAKDDWYYIYRWGVSPTHLSGARSPESFYQKVGQDAVQSGRFVLQPRWMSDYVALTRQH